jgi:raffinose/stachyose/melibiose transport system permease protein
MSKLVKVVVCIRALPTEVEEAAFMDGATTFDLLARQFLSTWNEFPFALVLLNDDVYKTMPLWSNTFQGERTVNYPGLMAALMIASVPVIAVYLIFREKSFRGLVLLVFLFVAVTMDTRLVEPLS